MGTNINNSIENGNGTFHGGFVRDRGEGRGVRVARSKASELPVPDPRIVQEAAEALAERDGQGFTGKPLRARRTKLSVMGLSSNILQAGNQDYKRCVKLAKNYQRVRTKELYEAYKYVSSGVSSLLSAASLALAGSRFLYEVAATSENPAGIIKTAASLADSARQNELSAWELCARESVIKARNAKDSEAAPWEVVEKPVGGNIQADGSVKRSRGRPRKDQTKTKELLLNEKHGDFQAGGTLNAGQLYREDASDGKGSVETDRDRISSIKSQGGSESGQQDGERSSGQDSKLLEEWHNKSTHITNPNWVLGTDTGSIIGYSNPRVTSSQP